MNNSSKFKKPALSVLAVILSVIAIFGITSAFNTKNSYSAYTSDHPYTNLKEHSDLNQINFTIVFKTGCKHCEKAQSTIIPNLKKLKEKNIPFTVTDVNNANNNVIQFLTNKNIQQTPTILVQYKNYTIYSYTGTNPAIINTLFSKINPDTLKPFKSEKPKYSIFKNDLTHSYNKQPIQDPN